MMRSILCGLLLAISTTAMADDLNYNFLSLGYERIELDDDFGFDIDGDGWTIGRKHTDRDDTWSNAA